MSSPQNHSLAADAPGHLDWLANPIRNRSLAVSVGVHLLVVLFAGSVYFYQPEAPKAPSRALDYYGSGEVCVLLPEGEIIGDPLSPDEIPYRRSPRERGIDLRFGRGGICGTGVCGGTIYILPLPTGPNLPVSNAQTNRAWFADLNAVPKTVFVLNVSERMIGSPAREMTYAAVQSGVCKMIRDIDAEVFIERDTPSERIRS